MRADGGGHHGQDPSGVRARRAASLLAGTAALLGAGKVALGATPPAAPMETGFAGNALMLAAGGFAVLVAALVALRARREAAKAAADLDIASRRLLVLEERVVALGRHLAIAAPAAPASPPQPVPVPPPPARDADTLELNVEIGLLGGLVKDLAETVAAHDKALDSLAADLGSLRRVSREDGLAAVPVAPAPPAAAAPAAAAAPIPVAASVAPALSAAVTPPAMPSPALPSSSAPAPIAPAVPVTPPAARREPTFTEAVPAPQPAFRPLAAEPSAPPVEATARRAEDAAASLIDAAREEVILTAAREGRIELHLQPIVTLPQRRVRFYEALSRLRLPDGALLTPAEFLPLLERRGAVARFDGEAFGRVLQVARHLARREAETAVSFNLCAASLAETGYLRALDRALATMPDLAGRIILEIPQRLLRELDLERLGALAGMAARGARLCVDRVSDLRFDPVALADRGVAFVKVPARLLLGAEAARADIHVGDLAAMLARAGVSLIAEKVEAEEEVRDLLDIDVPLAQGFLFAAPRPVRADVLGAMAGSGREPPPHAADPAPEAADAAQGPAVERKPFRAFLRRA